MVDNLNSEEIKVQKEAIDYINNNQSSLIQEFIIDKNPLQIRLATLFMAGSPGAGKTEFSKRYLPQILNVANKKLSKLGIIPGTFKNLFIRIDVDEVREFIPQYCKTNSSLNIKGNSHVIQKAAGKGLDILREYCLRNGISFLHDGTFGNYDTMREIIHRSIKDGRDIEIFYLYMDPVSAWEFTKKREFLEGRNIQKDKFIEQFFKSRENVDRAKLEFKDKVKVNCVLKDRENRVQKILFNAPSVQEYLNNKIKEGVIINYTKEGLLELLKEV